MKRFSRKKIAAIGVTMVMLLGGGGIAFAYFTSGGSGTGSAQVGTGPGNAFSITSTGPLTALTPGAGSQPFDVSVTNTSDQAAFVGFVSMSIATFPGGDAATAGGADIPGCLASWFTVDPTLDVDTTVGAGDTVSASGLGIDEPTIQMTESGTDQNACESASVGINFSA